MVRLEDISMLLAHGLESLPEAVTITDLNDRIIYVNEAFRHNYGYSNEEIIGQRPTILVPPGAVAEIFPLVPQATQRGGWKGELFNRAKDGSVFPIRLSTAPIRDEHGALKGLIGISEIIYEKRQHTSAASSSKSANPSDTNYNNPLATLQRHLRIFGDTPRAICMVGPEWQIRYANPAFSKMMGVGEWGSLDWTGADFRSMVPSPEEFDAFQQWAIERVEGPAAIRQKIKIVGLDGAAHLCEATLLAAHPSQPASGYIVMFKVLEDYPKPEDSAPAPASTQEARPAS